LVVDIASKVFSGVASAMRNPLYALTVVLIVLLFPLNLLDYLIWIIVNFGVAILNAVLWLLVMVGNALVWFINTLINAIVQGLWDAGIKIVDKIPSTDDPEIPSLDLIPYYTQPWADVDFVNIFGTNTTLLSILLSLFGLEFPIW